MRLLSLKRSNLLEKGSIFFSRRSCNEASTSAFRTHCMPIFWNSNTFDSAVTSIVVEKTPYLQFPSLLVNLFGCGRYGFALETQDATITTFPVQLTILIVGYVFVSGVLFSPGIAPADRPSHSYRKRSGAEEGCSVISTYGSFNFCCLLRGIFQNKLMLSWRISVKD